MAITSISDIQAQLAAQSRAQQEAATARRTNVGRGNYATDLEKRNAMVRDQATANNEAMALRRQDPSVNPAAAMQRIIGMGDQTYQDASNDPVDAMLREELTKRVQGGGPYDATTINALRTGAAEQGAAAEMANNQQAMQQLESRGFSPSDPSYQAALRQNQQQRQAGNQQANLSIAQNANLANYNAKGQAIGQAAQVGGQQKAQTLDAARFATQGLNQVSSADMGTTPSWQTLPTYSAFKNKKPATSTYR